SVLSLLISYWGSSGVAWWKGLGMVEQCRSESRRSKLAENDAPVRLRSASYAGHASPSQFGGSWLAEPKLAATARLRPLGFGAASFSLLSRAKDGGRDRDRTCDPYHVKVVLSR